MMAYSVGARFLIRSVSLPMQKSEHTPKPENRKPQERRSPKADVANPGRATARKLLRTSMPALRAQHLESEASPNCDPPPSLLELGVRRLKFGIHSYSNCGVNPLLALRHWLPNFFEQDVKQFLHVHARLFHAIPLA